MGSPFEYSRLKFMTSRSLVRRCALAVLGVTGACHTDSVGPNGTTPARLDPVSAQTLSAAVGTPLANALIVKVTDASGAPVPNTAVAFAVTSGNGLTNPRVAIT